MRTHYLLLGALLLTGAAASLPPDSLYQLDAELTTQAGEAAGLDIHRGWPTLISMFYASCPHACPLIINTLQSMQSQLEPAARARLRVLLVSFDPERDSPAVLHELAERHRVDERWTLARAPAQDVRELAAVLEVQYRRLPDGEFNHSTVIALLDRSGRIIAQTTSIGRVDEDFMASLREVLRTAQ